MLGHDAIGVGELVGVGELYVGELVGVHARRRSLALDSS